MIDSDLAHRPPARTPLEPSGLVVSNLMNDLSTLGPLLDHAADGHMWLDAYLLAAGMSQIIDDHLHDAPYPFDDAAALLAEAGSPASRVAGRIAAAGAVGTRRLLACRPGAGHALSWQRQVAGLVDALADKVIAQRGDPAALAERCHRAAAGIAALPAAARRSVMRLPACFHHFDQSPHDMELLTERFSRRAESRERPLLVVGVRTSGSYMAPLIAAALRRRGRAGVGVLTVRPGRALRGEERALVQGVVQGGGRLLLTDDPPVTCTSLLKAAVELERLGGSREAIVLLLALDGSVASPALASYPGVFLRAHDWSVRAQLRPQAVRSQLAQLLAEELDVHTVRQLPGPGDPPSRGHCRALFAVEGRDPVDGTPRELTVMVRGIGLAYLGAHQLGVARALHGLVPRAFGVRDGLLYEEWSPARGRIADEGPLADGIAAYVAARRQRLSMERDASATLVGQRPVWEVAGLLLGTAFGRAAPVARVTLVDPAMRRLLQGAPSVTDGRMTPEHWYAGADSRPLETGLGVRTDWNVSLGCCDGTFELAGVGAFSPDGTLAARVRRAWQRETGEDVDPERWLLYELAHLWGLHRADPVQEGVVRHASARSVQRYFAEVFLADLEPTADGPMVALDIDGGLETDVVGFPTLTRASAVALRALIAHGYRPVPVTGRGLVEVRDRCRSYGMAAGVAEYGSAVYLDEGGRVLTLVGDGEAAALRRLRAALLERDGVRLDPAHLHSVRAYRLRAGTPGPLSAAVAAECVAAAGGDRMVRVMHGDGQTDFVAAGVDKGRGLQALLDALGEQAAVPAHAAPQVHPPGAKSMPRAYQVGLALAVAQLLGHRPGGCALCRPAPATPQRELLLDLFSVAEGGRRGLPRGMIRAAAGSLRVRRHR